MLADHILELARERALKGDAACYHILKCIECGIAEKDEACIALVKYLFESNDSLMKKLFEMLIRYPFTPFTPIRSRKAVKKFVTCAICRKTDTTQRQHPRNVGTATTMRCDDCGLPVSSLCM